MNKTNKIIYMIISIILSGCFIITILLSPISTHGTKPILKSLNDPGQEWVLKSSDIQRDSIILSKGNYHATHTYSSQTAGIDKEHLYKYAENITDGAEGVSETIEKNIICYPSANLSDNVCEGHFNIVMNNKPMFSKYDEKTVYITMAPDIDNPDTNLMVVSVAEKWTPEKDKARN